MRPTLSLILVKRIVLRCNIEVKTGYQNDKLIRPPDKSA